MNFLLKIVEGPNKGAEIALVEGVAVTLGKSDDCDIILADVTMPDAPLTVEASTSGVTVDGSALEPFHVKTFGATSFAVGPGDAAWGELEWPRAEPARVEGDDSGHAGGDDESASRDSAPESAEEPARRRHGFLGCLVALVLILLLLLLAGLGWFYRDRLKDAWESRSPGVSGEAGASGQSGEAKGSGSAASTLDGIAKKYGLATVESNGVVRLSGNFRTGRERLAAAAEAYAAQPGVELDLSDDESFRTAAEDALFTLTEGALKVTQATNRFLAIGGSAHTPAALAKTLKALNEDLPKLRNVDVKDVKFSAAVADAGDEGDDASGAAPGVPVVRGRAKKAAAKPEFPVCGILTAPYPCLVMKNGARVLEGASVGGFVVEKIEADSVTVTNSTGRFTWKP